MPAGFSGSTTDSSLCNWLLTLPPFLVWAICEGNINFLFVMTGKTATSYKWTRTNLAWCKQQGETAG